MLIYMNNLSRKIYKHHQDPSQPWRSSSQPTIQKTRPTKVPKQLAIEKN